MDPKMTKETAAEVCKVLDTLTALSVDLSCHRDQPPERMVLSAAQVRHSCKTISEAVGALKRILTIAEANGGGLIPPGALAKFEQAAGD